jgi:hypothetical protein
MASNTREYIRQYQRDNRYNFKIEGKCRICDYEGEHTEKHHIIDQKRCKEIGKPEWINNAGNVVELCKPCHDETMSSRAGRPLKVVKGDSIEHLEKKIQNPLWKSYEKDGDAYEIKATYRNRAEWYLPMRRKGYKGTHSRHLHPHRYSLDEEE